MAAVAWCLLAGRAWALEFSPCLHHQTPTNEQQVSYSRYNSSLLLFLHNKIHRPHGKLVCASWEPTVLAVLKVQFCKALCKQCAKVLSATAHPMVSCTLCCCATQPATTQLAPSHPAASMLSFNRTQVSGLRCEIRVGICGVSQQYRQTYVTSEPDILPHSCHRCLNCLCCCLS